MRLEDIFHQLLVDRRIALELDSQGAESLRVSLIRKFKEYKTQTARLGWLSEDLETAVVSAEREIIDGKETGVSRFFLRPRRRKVVEYKLLEIDAPLTSDDSRDKE